MSWYIEGNRIVIDSETDLPDVPKFTWARKSGRTWIVKRVEKSDIWVKSKYAGLATITISQPIFYILGTIVVENARC